MSAGSGSNGVIAVIDYGMGNLRSVSKALEHVAGGKTVVVTADPAVVAAAERVVFPGQGAMPDCMAELDARGDVPALCVFPGNVKRFPDEKMYLPTGERLKVPHMGWNEIRQKPHALWNGIADGARFYFVHSYFVEPADSALVTGSCEYGVPFTCAVGRDNIFAVQFHPEKSARDGLQLLQNFVEWRP